MSDVLKRYGTVVVLGVVMVTFSILQPRAFMTMGNLLSVSRQISLLVIIALGATVVMVVDEFDLSIGAVASFSGILYALLARSGMPLFAAFLLTLGASALFGLANGFLVTHFGILSFITTLATGTLLGGVTFAICDGATIFHDLPKAFTTMGTMTFGSARIPLLSLIMLALCVVVWYFLSRMVAGRELYAIGGNRTAAWMCGLGVKRGTCLAFSLSSVFAALGGMLLASRLGSASPSAGDAYFLKAYATVFLGRTVSEEGVPNVWGTFVGAAILGVIANGLTILQIPSWVQDVLTGCIIIIAIIAQKRLGPKEE